MHRPRFDVCVPTDQRLDGYYRWGTVEGASKGLGVFAIPLKLDIMYWPEGENGMVQTMRGRGELPAG